MIPTPSLCLEKCIPTPPFFNAIRQQNLTTRGLDPFVKSWEFAMYKARLGIFSLDVKTNGLDVETVNITTNEVSSAQYSLSGSFFFMNFHQTYNFGLTMVLNYISLSTLCCVMNLFRLYLSVKSLLNFAYLYYIVWWNLLVFNSLVLLISGKNIKAGNPWKNWTVFFKKWPGSFISCR